MKEETYQVRTVSVTHKNNPFQKWQQFRPKESYLSHTENTYHKKGSRGNLRAEVENNRGCVWPQ